MREVEGAKFVGAFQICCDSSHKGRMDYLLRSMGATIAPAAIAEKVTELHFLLSEETNRRSKPQKK
jgi:hypothetical protein